MPDPVTASSNPQAALLRILQLQALLAPGPSANAPLPTIAPSGVAFAAMLERAEQRGAARAAPVAGDAAAPTGTPATTEAAAAVANPAPSGSSPESFSPTQQGLAWPVDAPITSEFGPRWGRQHSGIDLGAAQGTPVKAAGAGRVKSASFDGGYGNLVVIEHPDGRETRYAHMASLAVRAGETVRAGQDVGQVGSTGNSTGPHLHFEVRVDGEAHDPMKSLPKRG
jgi:murein DD-endopeptidase MepM/ murein hydrolase activator NlpD